MRNRRKLISAACIGLLTIGLLMAWLGLLSVVFERLNCSLREGFGACIATIVSAIVPREVQDRPNTFKVVFSDNLKFDPSKANWSVFDLYEYSETQRSFVKSGLGTYGTIAETKVKGRELSLVEYIASNTGHDINEYLAPAELERLSKPRLIKLKPEPGSVIWNMSEVDRFKSIDPGYSQLLIFPAQEGDVITRRSHGKYHYIFVLMEEGLDTNTALFDGCFLRASDQKESVVIEFPFRRDQYRKLDEIFREVSSALCS